MQLHKSFILFFPCFYDIFQIKNEAVPTFETAPPTIPFHGAKLQNNYLKSKVLSNKYSLFLQQNNK